jgi:hypothetical protein
VALCAGVLAGAGTAHAATLASGPLRVAEQNAYSCSAGNVGTREVDVEVTVTIDGGATGNGVSTTCAGLAPNAVCVAANDAASTKYRFCTVKTSNRKAVRGTFCNTTTAVCVPVQ